MRENHQKHRRRLRRRPNGAAAFGGRPIGSVFLWMIYGRYMDDIWLISWFNHTAFGANPIWKSPISLQLKNADKANQTWIGGFGIV